MYQEIEKFKKEVEQTQNLIAHAVATPVLESLADFEDFKNNISLYTAKSAEGADFMKSELDYEALESLQTAVEKVLEEAKKNGAEGVSRGEILKKLTDRQKRAAFAARTSVVKGLLTNDQQNPYVKKAYEGFAVSPTPHLVSRVRGVQVVDTAWRFIFAPVDTNNKAVIKWQRGGGGFNGVLKFLSPREAAPDGKINDFSKSDFYEVGRFGRNFPFTFMQAGQLGFGTGFTQQFFNQFLADSEVIRQNTLAHLAYHLATKHRGAAYEWTGIAPNDNSLPTINSNASVSDQLAYKAAYLLWNINKAAEKMIANLIAVGEAYNPSMRIFVLYNKSNAAVASALTTLISFYSNQTAINNYAGLLAMSHNYVPLALPSAYNFPKNGAWKEKKDTNGAVIFDPETGLEEREDYDSGNGFMLVLENGGFVNEAMGLHLSRTEVGSTHSIDLTVNAYALADIEPAATMYVKDAIPPAIT